MTSTETHCRLKAVYGDDVVNRPTVNRCILNFCGCEPGKTTIKNEKNQNTTIRKKTSFDCILGRSLSLCGRFSGTRDNGNSSRNKATLKHLRRRVCYVKSSLAPRILQHVYARPHTSRTTKDIS